MVCTCSCARTPHVQRWCLFAAATTSQRKPGLQSFSIQQIRKYLQSRTYCPPFKTIISWIGGSDILKMGKFFGSQKGWFPLFEMTFPLQNDRFLVITRVVRWPLRQGLILIDGNNFARSSLESPTAGLQCSMPFGTFSQDHEISGAGISSNIKESSTPRALITISLAAYFANYHYLVTIAKPSPCRLISM